MTRLLIAGVSTRAAAESAARAGFAVTALDAFADLDQHPSVRALSLPRDFDRPFSAHSAARASRTIDGDAVAYLSSFENHARAVTTLSTGRALWGNPPEVLRRVREPFLLAGTLRRRGFATPVTRVDVPQPSPDGFGEAGSGDWLVKPFRSGGGNGIRRWRPGVRVTRGHYAQEWIDGVPASIVFVAAGGRVVPLGVSRQLVGDAAFGASGYRYCGNVLVPAAEVELDRVVDAACELAHAVAEAFDLVGVNGIDFLARDGVPYVVEVNPRWCSSMELVERTYGISVFGAHAAACAHGRLPAFDLTHARRGGSTHGKAIVFAREDVVVGDTSTWLQDSTIRDVPRRGELIARGQPLCTVFAEGRDPDACRAALILRAEKVYTELVDIYELLRD